MKEETTILTRSLEKMPPDKRFYRWEYKKTEWCHATGIEVFQNGFWWNLYESPTDGALLRGVDYPRDERRLRISEFFGQKN